MTTENKPPITSKAGRKKAARKDQPQGPHIVSNSNFPAPSTDDLTPDELRLIQIYRQMSDSGQQLTMDFVENFMPRVRRPKPMLCLVLGGHHEFDHGRKQL
jgi:hypothetical protein